MYFYSKNEQFLLLPRTPGLPRSPGSQGCPRGCPQGCPGVALTLRLGVLGVGGGFTFLSVRKRGEGIFWLVVSVPGPRFRPGVDIYRTSNSSRPFFGPSPSHLLPRTDIYLENPWASPGTLRQDPPQDYPRGALGSARMPPNIIYIYI